MASLKTTTYADPDNFRKHRNSDKKKYYGKTAGIYDSRPWTTEEEERVLKHDIPDSELSKQIERSVLAIQIRRSRLRKKSQQRQGG